MTKDPVLKEKCKSSDRIFRGGSWYYNANILGASIRYSTKPGRLGDSVSFRLVRNVKEKK